MLKITDYAFLFQNTNGTGKTNPIGSFRLSQLNSKSVQNQLKAAGIDTNSKQYKAVMKQMMKDANGCGAMYTNPQAIKNLMKNYDSDGNFLNVYGVAGMDATGKSLSEMHQIIDVSEEYRQKMFDECKRHFIQENGVANGDTTKRTEVFTAYQKSVPIEDRLKGTWTLGQYERNYTLAFAEAVKAVDPNWKIGDPFDTKILDSVTRESVDASLVKSYGQYGEILVVGNTAEASKAESSLKNNSISRVENAVREGLKNYSPKIAQAKEMEVEIGGDIRAEKVRRLEKQLKEGTFKNSDALDTKA
ncbi:MAG: DUF3879 family protein [Bacteroides sp.]|nr:DUF3879 family protein [Bacteroides sp.]